MFVENSTVLIVDDIQTNLMLLEDLLAGQEIDVLKAENGKKALEMALLHAPDLILLDIIMPGQDGFEVCKKLKLNDKTKEIPIIFLTAKDQSNDIVKGFNVGAVDYIIKPFRTNELLARVFTHLELKHSKDTIRLKNEQLVQEIEIREKVQKELIESERKFSSLVTGLNDAVFKISYPDGKYTYISPAARKVFGYSKYLFYKTPHFIKKILHPSFVKFYETKLETSWGIVPTIKYKIIDPDGKERWIIQANKGTFDKSGNLVAIEGIYRNISTREELRNQKDKLERINQNITLSIKYAKFIQKAVLPSEEFLKQFIPKNFILYLPKDIVSGDFYWIKQVNNYIAVVAADCTGHGVPGAFMSMLGIAFLNDIVRLDQNPKANQILNELRKRLKEALRQSNIKDTNADGMEMALCIIDLEERSIQFSGANSPLYVVRKNKIYNKSELIEIRPDRMPIGIHVKEHSFTNHKLELQTDDILYLFSDGFINQPGGENNEKFKTRRFKSLLLKLHDETMKKQKDIITKTFEDWRSTNTQIDDVLVIGIKILKDYGSIDFF